MGAVRVEDLPNYTYDDYLQWEGDWEMIDGIAYAMSPSPSFEHQEINGNILVMLRRALADCKRCKVVSDIDWKVSDDTVVRPNTLVVCDLKRRGAYLDQVPQIIFEVLSPATKKKDRNLKYHLYASEGVQYYVMVEPAGMFAEIYRYDGKTYRLEGEFKDGEYTFDLDGCKGVFDFREVFEDM